MGKTAFAIIGAGKLGSALAYGLTDWGYTLKGVVSRSLASAKALADPFGAAYSVKGEEMISEAPVVFITTPDKEIGQVAQELAEKDLWHAGQYVFHMCGSLGASVLCPAKEKGAYIGGMHPLKAFAKKGKCDFSGTYFALDGDEQAQQLAGEMVGHLGGHTFQVPNEARPLYHAAACIASNYTVTLLHWAASLYEAFGLSQQQAVAALLPLVEGSLENIRQLGTVQALTGPISRGDETTLAAHLKALQGSEGHLYALLAQHTLGVAKQKGSLSEEQAAELKQQTEAFINWRK